MIDFGYFEEMERKIAAADFNELVRLRERFLGEVRSIEAQVGREIAAGDVMWREDLCFGYVKHLDWISRVCKRLAECYENAQGED